MATEADIEALEIGGAVQESGTYFSSQAPYRLSATETFGDRITMIFFLPIHDHSALRLSYCDTFPSSL